MAYDPRRDPWRWLAFLMPAIGSLVAFVLLARVTTIASKAGIIVAAAAVGVAILIVRDRTARE